MVGLVPTIHPTTCSGVPGLIDARGKPKVTTGIIVGTELLERGQIVGGGA
jgi:hypothetical protein